MTEHEDMEELGLGGEHGEHGEAARELFARTAAEARPMVGFTADGVVLAGRRRVRRRRVTTALASTASVAAVAVAATAFAGSGASKATVAAGAPARSLEAGAPSTLEAAAAASRTDAEQGYDMVTKLFSELDPGGKLLTLEGKPLSPENITQGGVFCQTRTKFLADFASGGKQPTIQVMVSVASPGQAFKTSAGGEGWGPVTKSTLPDGSVLETSSAVKWHGVQAIRTMSDQTQIVVSAQDAQPLGAAAGNAKPTDPIPYTAAQFGKLASDVSLPLPFTCKYLGQH